MGLTHVAMEVGRDDGPHCGVRFIVDSGATYSVLPWKVWHKLGLTPKRRLDFVLADGSTMRRGISDCRFFYRDIDAPSPVILGVRGDVALLGAVMLETFGLVLNPFRRSLEPMRMMLASAL